MEIQQTSLKFVTLPAFYTAVGLMCCYKRSPAFPQVFMKFEVGQRLEPKLGGVGTAFSCVPLQFNHCGLQ